jgi:ribosomal protein S18 acetylase RimI-like enzyme
MPSIARAGESDLPAILALQKLAYLSEAELYDDYSIPPLTQTLENMTEELGRAVFLKAQESDGEIVGSVRATASDGTCQIGRLAVHPAHRRRGIGSALMHAIEACFPRAERLELFTGDRSVDNQRLYRGMGYSEFKRAHLTGVIWIVFMQKPGPACGPPDSSGVLATRRKL